MLVTIIADASYCPFNSVGTYGYWIASDRGSIGGGGALMKGEVVKDSVVCEMMALVNAVHVALKEGYASDCDTLLLQSDCQTALDALSFARASREVEAPIVKKLNEYMLRFSLTLRFRHVKGHTQRKESRFVTNVSCDSRASSEMKKLRKQIHRRKRKQKYVKHP